MSRYSQSIREKVRDYRALGKTYSEIRKLLELHIPKSTLSVWSKGVVPPKTYKEKIVRMGLLSLEKARRVAAGVHRLKREAFFHSIRTTNTPIAQLVKKKEVGKIALAMLCLGEASKYNAENRSAFSLGNSDPKIITIYLKLLHECFPSFDSKKVRCTVQCRADQDPKELKIYWMQVTGVPDGQFYKPQIDPRTKGKPTKKVDYKGVLRVDYFDTKVQLELESLADLVYNQLH